MLCSMDNKTILIMYLYILELVDGYRKANKIKKNSQDYNSFCIGCVQEAVSKLKTLLSDVRNTDGVTGKEIIAVDQGLVRYEEARNWWQQQNPDVQLYSGRTRYNSSAAEQGKRAASNISVRAGVGSSIQMIGR